MKFFIVSILCFLSAFQGSQSRGLYPVTDEVMLIFEALRNGDVQSVENSLTSVSVDSTNDHDYTFLCLAAAYGNEAMVQMLLKHGADVNKGDGRNQFTPLRAANAGRMCDFGDRACDPRSKVDYDRISEFLIKNGADVLKISPDGSTLLHDLAEHGLVNVAEMAFKNGASKLVNNKSRGDTPLCNVAQYGVYAEDHDKVTEMLIQNGAMVNLRCRNEQTPLHSAARKGFLGVVKILVENGAEVSPKDSEGKTPLDLAKRQDWTSSPDSFKAVIEYLEQHEKH